MIGRLKFRAELWQKLRLDNGAGGFTQQPTKIAEIWVNFESRDFSSFTQYQKAGTEAAALITCRKRNLDRSHYFIVDGEVYAIDTIDQAETNYTICSCVRSGANV